MHDPQTLNKAISQATKCENKVFQLCQDQCSWNSPKYSYSYPTASTTISSSHSEAEDMQIDAIWYKPLTA
jgi:hypothetical protein